MNADSMYQQTTWRNPTDHEVRFSIFEGPGRVAKMKVPPGNSVALPSVYDDAIQTVREGVIVGGLAPQLEPQGREKFPMHVALARAAEMGETERQLMRSTGTTAGAMSLDFAAQLQKQNDALTKRLAELEAALGVSAGATPANSAPARDAVVEVVDGADELRKKLETAKAGKSK